MGEPRTFLTSPPAFRDVSRGNPRPFTLKGEALIQARLTPETWRLEIVSDGNCQIDTPRTLDKGNALDVPTLEKMGRTHGRRFLKAMQCLNIAQPLGAAAWLPLSAARLLQIHLGLHHAVDHALRVGMIRRQYLRRQHQVAPQVQHMLGLVSQVRPTVLHFRDAAVRIIRRKPLLVARCVDLQPGRPIYGRNPVKSGR